MKNRRFKLSLILSTALLPIFPTVISCNQAVAPSKIEIDGLNSVVINKENTYTIKSPDVGACLDVDWAIVSEGGEATISNSGVLSPTKKGNIIIVAISKLNNDVQTQHSVTIYENSPEFVSLDFQSAVDVNDHTEKINYKVLPEGKCPSEVKWTVEDENILKVDPDGTVHPHSFGETTVTCSSVYTPTTKSSINISVVTSPTSIELSGLNYALLGCDQQYSLSLKPTSAYQGANWVVEPENLATFDSQTNTLSPKGVGKVTLTATSIVKKKLSDSIGITISDVAPTDLTINGLETIYLGNIEQFSVTVEPENSPQCVYWSIKSKDGVGYATISTDGKITPIRAGQVTVTATSIDKKISKSLNVNIELNKEFAFYTDDWSKVAEIAKKGFEALKTNYGLETFIGIERQIIIHGHKHRARVIGENCDNLEGGSGNAALTFEICTPLASDRTADTYQWDDDGSNVWNHQGQCSLRQLLNTDIKGLIDEGLGFTAETSPIRRVLKETCLGNSSSVIVCQPETVWLMSVTESGVKKSLYSVEEGSCYPYYQNINSSKSPVLIKQTYDEKTADYWFRSPDISSNNEVWLCYATGQVNINDVGGKVAIAPCFCL